MITIMCCTGLVDTDSFGAKSIFGGTCMHPIQIHRHGTNESVACLLNTLFMAIHCLSGHKGCQTVFHGMRH